MNKKKFLALFSLLIILAFIGYIIYDTIRPARDTEEKTTVTDETAPPDKWRVLQEVFIGGGLKAIAVSDDGNIYLGGDSLIWCYNKELKEIWNLKTPAKITAITVYGDTVFAASEELVFLLNKDGKMITEWGPYEANCIITSLSANKNYLAIADAGNKIAFIVKKDGEVLSMIGHFGEKLLIPSPYFDVCLTNDNNLFLANTGNFRIEKRTIEGKILLTFGESGTGPAEFCGCCNPAHFALIPQGFVTAEKGINRIKIMGPEGGFIEFVSSQNNFIPSAPLDVASADGKTIYGANPADGKLYVFIRK
jgi:hypothetical protein